MPIAAHKPPRGTAHAWQSDALAVVVALAVTMVVIFSRDHVLGTQRTERLALEVQGMAALVESVSSNGVVMSGATLLGVMDARTKRLLAGMTEPLGEDTLADFTTILKQFRAITVSVLGPTGETLASLAEDGKTNGIGRNFAQRADFQQAMKGSPSVYPVVDNTNHERRLHFSAPVYDSSAATHTTIIGVYHIETDMAATDLILEDYGPRTALLVSPDGIVFASNRPSFQLKHAYPLAPGAKEALLGEGQFGQTLPLDVNPLLASSPQTSQTRIDGLDFGFASAKINWPSSRGSWQVILMEENNDSLAQLTRAGLAITVFSVLFAAYFALSRHNRGQRTYSRVLQAKQAEQAKALRTIEAQLDFQERLMDAVPTPMFVKDAQGRSIGLNRAYEEAYGLRREDIAGKTLVEAPMKTVSSAQREMYFQEQLNIIATGGQVHKSRAMEWQDGTIHHELYWGQGIRRADGEPAGMVGVILDVSSTVHANEALKVAKEAAEEAGNAKSAFLANMSHEIRTPMNAIIGLAHLALRTNLDTQQRDYVKKVHSAGQSLLGIINDILDFSKIEAGKLEIECIPFDLDDVFTQVSTVTSAKAWDKELELLFNVPQNVGRHWRGDPLRLGQVLVNLINNAIKFTEHGQIMVACTALATPAGQNTGLQFEVSDTGIGMTTAQCAKLFTPFSQADSSTTRKFGGTGLGLSISKRLVEMTGGSIGVRSEAGAGSVFHFTWVCEEIPTSEALPARPLALPSVLHGLHVLVVDDNADARNILSEALRPFVQQVDAVASGAEAITQLHARSTSNTPYSLVMTDWKMPEMDGITLTQHIKAAPQLHPTPTVVLVTAFGREEVRQQAEQALVDGFLVKPINASTLVDTLVRLFDGHTTHDLSQRAPTETIPDLHGLRVLLVEDNEINQQIAIELMQSAGVAVDVADNGNIAVDKLQTAGPAAYHLVLMDLQMPVMDGHQATQLIRQNPTFNDLPIIAMTAHAMVEERERCLAEGMNDHVTKPIDPARLYQALLHWGQHGLQPATDASTNRVRQGQANAPHPDSSTETTRLQAALPQFDIPGALRRVAGNLKLLTTLLHRYLDEQCNAPERISAAVALGDWKTAEIAAHTLKGVSGNLGVQTVQDHAMRLEQALHSGANTSAELADHANHTALPSLIEATAQAIAPVQAELTTWFASTAAGTATSVSAGASAPETGLSDPSFQAALQNLLTLLSEMDGSALDALEALAPQLRAALPSDQMAHLQHHIEQFEFEEAAALLQAVVTVG